MPTTHDRRSPSVDDLVDPAKSLDPIGLLPLRPEGAARSPVAARDEPRTAALWRRTTRLAGTLGALTVALASVVVVWHLFAWIIALPGQLSGLALVGLFALGHGYGAYARWRDGPRPIADALRALAPDIEVMPTVRTFDDHRFEPLSGLVIRLRADPEGQPFDPQDVGDRRMAEALYRCRTADGLALQHGLRIDMPRIGRASHRPKTEQMAQWVEIWRWLQSRCDPRSMWLGAMALAERDSSHRALRALDALGDVPWRDSLLQAMASDGAWAARAAAALHVDEPAPLDALIDGLHDMAPGLLIELLRARLRLPGPPVERWLQTPALGAALVQLDAGRLTAAQWLRLVEHPAPTVAAAAASRALSHDVTHALRAARRLLAREDVPAAARTDADVASLVELMLIRLAVDGDASDLVRIGAWLDVRPLRRAARRELSTLQARIAVLPASGGLALSAEGGGELALGDTLGGRA